MEGLLGVTWTWILFLPWLALQWCGGILDGVLAELEGGPVASRPGGFRMLLGVLTLAVFFTVGGHLHFYLAWSELMAEPSLAMLDPTGRVHAIGLTLVRSLEDGLLFALVLSASTMVSGGWILLALSFIGRVNPMLSLSLRQTSLVRVGMVGTLALALSLHMDVWSEAHQEAHDAAETLVHEVMP